MRLETDRLILREWQEKSDLKPMIDFYTDPKTAKYVGGPKQPEEIWRLMATYIGHFTLRGYGYWALEEKQSRSFAGAVGLWQSPEWPELELGYWILPHMQGRGFATEASLRCLEFAFHELKVETLVSYIAEDNLSSKAVAKKLGAYFDGTVELAHYGIHEVYRYPGAKRD